jgi:hypothetical protein
MFIDMVYFRKSLFLSKLGMNVEQISCSKVTSYILNTHRERWFWLKIIVKEKCILEHRRVIKEAPFYTQSSQDGNRLGYRCNGAIMVEI